MVILYDKASNMKLSTHFSAQEFKCPCGDCKEILVDKGLVSMLEALRTILGSKLKITSGYRCADYQAQLRLIGYETAIGRSQHELGRAADISNGVTPGSELADYAKRVGFKAIGVGKTFIHVDMRDDKERLWYYKRV